MIEAEGIGVIRGGRRILADVGAVAATGRVLGLVGPNGAGKSTFLATLYKALRATEGSVRIDGDDVAGLRRRAIARRVAVVAQHGDATLPLAVRDSVALGRLSRESMVSYGAGETRRRVDAALAHVGLTGFADRLTSELSGGELQRVLIARAMVQDASHLLLDEPTNHLDIHHQYRTLRLVSELPTTTVIVLHDLNLAAQFCDDLVLLDHGRVVASGPPFEVLTPERVSAVYRIDVDVIDHAGRRHLVFSGAGVDADAAGGRPRPDPARSQAPS